MQPEQMILRLSNVLGITPSDDGGTFICGEILDSNTGNVERLVAKLSANGGILCGCAKAVNRSLPMRGL